MANKNSKRLRKAFTRQQKIDNGKPFPKYRGCAGGETDNKKSK